MKLSRTSKRRVSASKDLNIELKVIGTSLAQAHMVIDQANKKANSLKFKKPAKQALIFRTNIGKIVATEQNETASAIVATKRDRTEIIKKYAAIKG